MKLKEIKNYRGDIYGAQSKSIGLSTSFTKMNGQKFQTFNSKKNSLEPFQINKNKEHDKLTLSFNDKRTFQENSLFKKSLDHQLKRKSVNSSSNHAKITADLSGMAPETVVDMYSNMKVEDNKFISQFRSFLILTFLSPLGLLLRLKQIRF